MGKSFIVGCCLLLATNFTTAQEKKYLENLSNFIENTAVYGWNQEEGRTYHIPEKHLSLNGDWKFFFSETPEGIPSTFYQPAFNDKKWDSLPVPSNWEMLGYGDKLFRNVNASFKTNPPFVPKEYNPTGAYRKTFNIPASWKGDQIFLRLEKVASASFIWINGHEVGYNEGAQEPAEYNITKYLKPGKNTLAVHVVKFSDGYYLESQDYWRLAGIFDDVWLYATPSDRIFDWFVETDLDDTYTDATLKLQVDLKRHTTSKVHSYRVKAELIDANNKLVTNMESEPILLEKIGKQTVQLSKFIQNPKKWTSETPHLYTLKMKLISEDGRVQDAIETHIGFKETTIKGETFYVNGQPQKVNAINSHMQHPEQGHVITEETIRKDFEILKRFNVNAVRTSHYPPVNKYLELADEYGLYIIDEAGVEAHATEFVSELPEFTEMYRERTRQMVLRDRNHPCVLFWSAGNESGEGFNINEVVKEGKKYDPTRYWMYGGNRFSHPAEDIIGPRYPQPIELEMQIGVCPDSFDIRPSFMDEYLSVVGNGCGALDDFWRVVFAHPRTMGGALWDFVSPGLKEPVRQLTDQSTFQTPVHLMGNSKLVQKGNQKVLDLNGHDEWVEIYRQPNVEIESEELTLRMDVFPRKLNSSCGSFLTKGSYQFGLQQHGKDSLDFYIYTNKAHRLRVKLPDNWEYNWHELVGVYDHKSMSIYIDKQKIGEQPASGKIKNFPFPINIGRNMEIHGQETNVYICDAQLDNIGIFTKAIHPEESFLPHESALWLDFESEKTTGTFYSYGIGARTYGCIWPDRTVQPEMWQMKKSVQPISISWLDEETGLIEIWNRNHFLNASHYQTKWFLEADGKIIDEGILDLNVEPLSKVRACIPINKPRIEPGVEYRITTSSRLKKDEIWASAGFEVAWDQLDLPWTKEKEQTKKEIAPISYTEKNGQISVLGKDFQYIFDKHDGALISIQYKGKEMLKEAIRMNVWRAPLGNELDGWNSPNAQSLHWEEGQGERVATEYYSTGIDRLSHHPISMEVCSINNKIVINAREICLTANSEIRKKDLYISSAVSNGFENIYTYTITGDGQIKIHHKVFSQGDLPLWLPRMGMTMTLQNDLNQVTWYGRGPQENYPDRKTGYKVGVYQMNVDDMYEPYLIPQDYGLRTDNRWVKMTDEKGLGLSFSMNELFNFNAYPFSTENLTNALYTFQLKRQDGITFNLDYETTGLGCTARAVFNSYKVYPGAFEREIFIQPISK